MFFIFFYIVVFSLKMCPNTTFPNRFFSKSLRMKYLIQPLDHLKVPIENGLKQITKHLECEPPAQLSHWECFFLED